MIVESEPPMVTLYLLALAAQPTEKFFKNTAFFLTFQVPDRTQSVSAIIGHFLHSGRSHPLISRRGHSLIFAGGDFLILAR